MLMIGGQQCLYSVSFCIWLHIWDIGLHSDVCLSRVGVGLQITTSTSNCGAATTTTTTSIHYECDHYARHRRQRAADTFWCMTALKRNIFPPVGTASEGDKRLPDASAVLCRLIPVQYTSLHPLCNELHFYLCNFSCTLIPLTLSGQSGVMSVVRHRGKRI